MDRTPEKRIGVKDKAEIKNHQFFDGIDWEKVYKKEYPPPEAEIFDQDENNINLEVINILIYLINIIILCSHL